MRKSLIAICSVLAVAIILLAALVPGCTDGAKYELTMAVSPAGSGTVQDVTSTSPYASGTAVYILASPAAGYTFVKWTAPAGTFANPNAAATTFTMPAQNVTVTAHFVGPLDHFKAYQMVEAPPQPRNVRLIDEFGEYDESVLVGNATLFCNPTEKVHSGNTTAIWNTDHHLAFYWLACKNFRQRNVEVKNQFGTQLLTIEGPVALAVPTQKQEPLYHNEPVGLDYYLIYAVVNEVVVGAPIGLKDEFGDDPTAGVGQAIYFANPVEIKVSPTDVIPITHPDYHLVFYKLSDTGVSAQEVYIKNQFEERSLAIQGPADLVGVPSEQLEFGEQLDHFTTYLIGGDLDLAEPAGTVVSLKDQFVDITTTVLATYYFCNPATKTVTELWPPIMHPDYHFTLYELDYNEYTYWEVLVENQFGKQQLTVYGPVGLAVPARKLVPGDHQPPVGLDHFLIYTIMYEVGVDTPVWVKDEFCSPSGEQVTVQNPIALAVPVRKTIGSEVTEITNQLTHLVFYSITGAQESWPWVLVDDQFLSQNLTLGEPAWMLGVPSLKLLAWPSPI